MSHNLSPIYYAAVAGDVLGTYRRWREGQRDERQTAMTYSGQFFDLCERTGRRGVASFPSIQSQSANDDRFIVRSRPRTLNTHGLRFHLDQLRNAAWLWLDIARTRASDVVIMDGVTHFFLLAPVAWAGRRIFLSVHTVLWSKEQRLSIGRRLVSLLNRWFLRRYCAGCLAASPAIAEQLRLLARGGQLRVALFNPLYDRGDFESFVPPNVIARPFRIFFAGRIETDKGVFDLLENVRRLIADGRNVRLDYCGDGASLAALREAIASTGLAKRVFAHGHLDRPALLELLNQAQLVVVPTRSSFPEGLNQVVVEAVLAGRPIVTSAVCPALGLVSAAAVEAKADDEASYREAITLLMDNPVLYAEKVAACAALREEFFDRGRAWAATAYEMIAGEFAPYRCV